MRKKALAMDGRYSIMIENAFYYCNPPENKQAETKVRSPIHEYIKKLLYKDLNKLNVEKVSFLIWNLKEFLIFHLPNRYWGKCVELIGIMKN